MNDVTQILEQIDQGDLAAPEKLLPLVYDELRRLAAGKMGRESSGHTLQATALVHEAYVKLVGSGPARSFNDRRHFFAAAATAMKRILVDRARAKNATKRGGNLQREMLPDVAAALPNEELLALAEALEKLKIDDPLKAELVELRYFVGMTGDEAAETLGISPSSADRHWAFARAWLQNEVRGE
ncbi:MAG: ECF-type sigma factor [Aureliella sp.]